MSHAKIIELNGKRYDAATGHLLDRAATPHAKTVAVASLPLPAEVKKAITVRKSQHTIQPHKPERARTLMRHVVKKPKTIPVKQGNAKRSNSIIDYYNLSSQRRKRAKETAKSPLISHFGQVKPLHQPISKKLAVLPVRPAPAHHVATRSAESHRQTINHLAKRSVPKNTIEHALAHANSHNLPRLKKHRLHHRTARRLGVSTRTVNLAAACLAILLLSGFVAYQNSTNLAVRVASARAGFDAHMPKHQPAGFSMAGPIQVSTGVITISFKSTSDSRNFKITQQPSSWTSQALLNNFVSHWPHYTNQANGQTVYIYNKSNATWVNQGVWYTLEGNSSLNSQQILELAANI